MKKTITTMIIVISCFSLISQDKQIKNDKEIVSNLVYQYYKCWMNSDYKNMIGMMHDSVIVKIAKETLEYLYEKSDLETIEMIEKYYMKKINEISDSEIVLYELSEVIGNKNMERVKDVKIKSAIVIGNRASVKYSFILEDEQETLSGVMKLMKEDKWKILN